MTTKSNIVELIFPELNKAPPQSFRYVRVGAKGEKKPRSKVEFYKRMVGHA